MEQVDQIGPKRTEIGQIHQSDWNWTKLDQVDWIGPKWTELDWIGPNWTAFQIGKLVLEASTKFLSAIGHMMFNLLELFFLKGEAQVYVAWLRLLKR